MITRSPTARKHCRRSFTLVELLIVIAILTVLSSAILFALFGVAENAKEARTKAQIAKINELIMTKWEGYRARAVRMVVTRSAVTGDAPITPPPIINAQLRLMAIRDMMRMELPDRKTDLNDDAVTTSISFNSGLWSATWQGTWTHPAVFRMYRRRAGYTNNSSPPPSVIPPASWTTAHQGAECLYLILSGIREGEKSGLDFFKETEFGDVDDDGMPEILDAWGTPIEFLRWAPGFSFGVGLDGQWGIAGSDDDADSTTDNLEERGMAGSDDEVISSLNIPDETQSPDPFDPYKVDDRLRSLVSEPNRVTFAQYPLVYSAGRDKEYDITSDESPTAMRYSQTPLPMDPFYVIPPPAAGEPERQLGFPVDAGNDGELNHVDNITNHLLDAN